MEASRPKPARLPSEASETFNRTSSPPGTILPAAILSSSRHRYESLQAEEEETTYKGAAGEARPLKQRDSVHGLRKHSAEDDLDQLSIDGTSRKSPGPELPDSGPELLSPESALSSKEAGCFASPGQSPYPDDQTTTYGRSSPNSVYSPYISDVNESSRKLRPSIVSPDPAQALHGLHCRTRRRIQTARSNWLSITILTLSIYSTIFSAIWLGLAVTKPRYHRHIANTSSLTPSTASLLFTAIAKSIELSFVTVFVMALGQMLSQKAISKNSKGITVADMLLRQWVQQPGSLITHWETIRYSALSFLGALTLTATVISMLYTTASDGLVTPNLKFGGKEKRELVGEVKTIFGNDTYQRARCKTPMTELTDSWYAGATCMEIEHSGEAYHNFMQFLPQWDDFSKHTKGSTEMSKRPPPVAMLWHNTTVTGSWIEETDMPLASARYDRIINNVTLAMPLTAVIGAARARNNSILQPQDFNGLGEYYVHASLPSPAINVMCVAMTKEELRPLVYTEWPHSNNGTKPNASSWPGQFLDKLPQLPSFGNTTAVDELFGWGEKYGRAAPIFPKIPEPFQSVMNSTDNLINDVYPDSIYVLAKSNITNSSQLCSIRASMYPHCSTEYQASMSGGNLTSHCNDPNNDLKYSISHPEATAGVPNHNWTTVANRWAATMSLGTGITDDPASNPRLLTQLMPLTRALDPGKPSIAEALAVQAGCTVILSALDSPLIHYWNNSNQGSLDAPFWEKFNATVCSQEYSSGGTQAWQGIFYIVLVGTFLLNVACLIYFLSSAGLITDYMEPHTLFALAINSPPSRTLEGSCGGGPEEEELKSKWHIDMISEADHFYLHSVDEPAMPGLRERKKHDNRDSGWEMQVEGSQVGEQFERLAKKSSPFF